jgi:hypothetical protein
MYYFARLAPEVEERLVILFRQSKVIGGLYRSLGQEGESVATAYALERRDAVLPLIRNMGALMTVGVRPRPQHPHRPRIVGPISMLGDSIPVAAGIAMGARMRGKPRVARRWMPRSTWKPKGVQAEVIDLRTLAPLDRETILTSVSKISRALLLYEARRTGGIGGELAAIIAEEAFEYLDAPIMRIASVDAPVPYAPPLEAAFLPSVEKVVAGAKRLVKY